MLQNFLSVAAISTALLLMSGCATLKQSRIPEFIDELDQFEFSAPERETIGQLLDYINELENDV